MLKYMGKENFEVTSKLIKDRDNYIRPLVRFVKEKNGYLSYRS
jgi:hypothetical protein